MSSRERESGAFPVSRRLRRRRPYDPPPSVPAPHRHRLTPMPHNRSGLRTSPSATLPRTMFPKPLMLQRGSRILSMVSQFEGTRVTEAVHGALPERELRQFCWRKPLPRKTNYLGHLDRVLAYLNHGLILATDTSTTA